MMCGGGRVIIDDIIKTIYNGGVLPAVDKIPLGIDKIKIKQVQEEFTKELIEELSTIPVIITSKAQYDRTRPLTDFNKIKLPFERVFVEFRNEEDDKAVGIHLTNSPVYLAYGADYALSIYLSDRINKANQVIAAFIKKDKLPRIYTLCTSKCELLNESTTVHLKWLAPVCMKTERVSCCTHVEFTIECLKGLIETLDKFNHPEYEVTYTESPSPRKPKGTTYVPRESNRSIIYLNTKRTVYAHSGEGRKGTPKSPHHRRGFYRHYKSGKVGWVNESYIHGANKSKQKVYKV
jgi:hypothetical protein